MSFFYNLNKRLADLAAKQDATQLVESKQAESIAQSPLTQALNEAKAQKVPGMQVTHKDIEKHFSGSPLKWAQAASDAGFSSGRINQTLDNLKHGKNPNDIEEAGYSAKAGRAGKDLGKPGKNFGKIAKSAGERYGSKAAGERVAGAVLNKLRHPTEGVDKEAFAKLAPPTDKITYADKIAGAKKKKTITREADPISLEEMLTDEGNEFTDARLAAIKSGKQSFSVGGKTYRVTGDTSDEAQMDEGYAEMDAWLKSREKEKGTGRFDKKKISTGTVYTRKPETFDDPETDPEATGGAPKRKGRPAGTKRAIGAKHSGRSKLARKDAIAEEDQEVCSECGQAIVYEKAPPGAKAERMVKHIKKSLSKDGKLSDKDKAIAYATTWKAKKAGKVEEESTDKEDQKAEKAGKKVAKDIEYDEKHKGKDDNKAEKAGKKVTKDIEYDDKKDKEEKVDETTTSGSVATATAAPKASKGMQFGKGVYEGLNSKLETMITESMNVTVNMSTDEQGQAQKSITVTATDEDADKLAELLKMAGLGHKQQGSCGCGTSPCSCAEIVDENSPDWPTKEETLEAEPNLRTYSGGLNGPKSTGQTTVPVVASQLRRTSTMEENVELERSLFKTWKNYKG